MRVSLHGVVRSFGARTVLDHVDLTLGPRSRLGLVGPNGAGKSTLLRLLGGLDEPDDGRVERTPASLTVGYLPQEHDRRPGETLLAYLARRTGVAEAEADVERHTAVWSPEPYAAALERFLALGGADLEARARATCAELGLAVSLDQPTVTLSGGEAARAGLAAILLSRFDILLLDEPTNDLDFDGLDRLERFVDGFTGGLAVVSHDRAFLDRTVTRIAEIDPWTGGVREYAGGWSDFEAARALALDRQYDAFERAQERTQEVQALLNARRNQARAGGAMTNRRGTHALMTKVRQAERALERVDQVEKPYEPWRLQLSLGAAQRPGDRVASLEGAVGERGAFRLGPSTSISPPASGSRSPGGTAAASRPCSRSCSASCRSRRAGGHSAARRSSRRSTSAGRPTTATSRCSKRSPPEHACRRRTRAPCSRSSTSAPSTCSGPAGRSRRASGRGRTWRS